MTFTGRTSHNMTYLAAILSFASYLNGIMISIGILAV